MEYLPANLLTGTQTSSWQIWNNCHISDATNLSQWFPTILSLFIVIQSFDFISQLAAALHYCISPIFVLCIMNYASSFLCVPQTLQIRHPSVLKLPQFSWLSPEELDRGLWTWNLWTFDWALFSFPAWQRVSGYMSVVPPWTACRWRAWFAVRLDQICRGRI